MRSRDAILFAASVSKLSAQIRTMPSVASNIAALADEAQKLAAIAASMTTSQWCRDALSKQLVVEVCNASTWFDETTKKVDAEVQQDSQLADLLDQHTKTLLTWVVGENDSAQDTGVQTAVASIRGVVVNAQTMLARGDDIGGTARRLSEKFRDISDLAKRLNRGGRDSEKFLAQLHAEASIISAQITGLFLELTAIRAGLVRSFDQLEVAIRGLVGDDQPAELIPPPARAPLMDRVARITPVVNVLRTRG